MRCRRDDRAGGSADLEIVEQSPARGVHTGVMSIIRGVGLLGVVAGLVACALATPRESQRPNIVWLSVEDMSPWLPCYGDDTVPTPNLDRLAAESIRFTNAFATSPVCAPARLRRSARLSRSARQRA